VAFKEAKEEHAFNGKDFKKCSILYYVTMVIFCVFLIVFLALEVNIRNSSIECDKPEMSE